MKKRIHYAAAAALFFLLPSQAFADCDDISKDEEWRRNLIDVAAFHDHGDYEQSLEIGLKMTSKCDRSPALNYYIASNYQELGDNSKALEYILKASDGTTHMATSKENEESIKRKRKELETIVMGETSVRTNLIKFKNEYKAAMWSGIGVAIAGTVLTIVGASLAAIPNKDSNSKDSEITQDPLACDINLPTDEYYDCILAQTPDPMGETNSSPSKYSNTNVAGYAFLGSGLVMLVGGAILGGIYGYKYTHFDEDNVQISFHLTPMSAGLKMTF
ncbi:MAG: hypothetical protein J6A01_02515 [Proteobacteria bacterium]|nr:hypothetical protein [Pseudomonadota bacterium]